GTWYPFFHGQDLERFELEALEVARFLTQVRHEMIERAERLLIQWSRCLQGRTSNPSSLSDESCDEASLEQTFARVPIFFGFLNVARSSLALDAGEFERAWSFAELARSALSGSAETIWHHELDFQRGLCAVARAGALSNWEEEVAQSLNAIARRARSCPRNFSYQHELLEALAAAQRGDVTAANTHFERAVLAADSAQSARARALTHEAYGKFWQTRGDLAQARTEFGLARLACAEYKAHRKLSQLERLDAEITSSEAFSDNSNLDVWSALKATQAIAAELEWERLLPRLIQILIENTGAERGVLLEADASGLQLIVEGSVNAGASVAEPPVPLAAAELPRDLIQRVHDTAVVELLSDARQQPKSLDAEYAQRRAPRSVLCVPVRWQNTARGVLYL
ncbi:MAG TPA: GAF domain-containing protein, partial [Polyangiales bacterium]|nr:GAF domain-containing protein [Polyangiales bacterium]